MRRAFVDPLQRLLGRTLNIKISNYRKFQELLARADAAAASEWPEFPPVAARPVDEQPGQLQDVRALEEAYRARLRRLNASYQQFISRQLRSLGSLVAATARPSADGRPDGARERVFVVLTTTAQFPQLRALVGSTAVRARYDLVVVAYLETFESGILDFCKSNRLTLLSHELRTLCGEQFVSNSDPEEELSVIDSALAATSEPDSGLLHALADLLVEVRRQKAVAIGVQRTLLYGKASLLILFEDNAEYETGTWVAVAQELAIPSVIIPYTIADALEPAEAHYHDTIFWPDEGVHNRLAKLLMPHWLYAHRDRLLLRRNGTAILAAEALGTAPPAPWVLNSSRAEAIAVEGEAMRRHYLAQGIPEAQLVVTGSMTDDLMYAAMRDRARLRKELDLDDRPVLLCSIPPNQLTATRPSCEFASFHAIADYWMGELGKLAGWQVVLKLHPSMRTSDIDYLKTFGLRISDLDTSSLIPLCDLYNASVSSTIRWALACGKPVLNYDVYRYHYQDFASESAVLTVFESGQFAGALRRLTQDADALAQLTEHARASAARWGILDGHCMSRIVDLFDDLASRGRQAAA